MSNFLTEDEIEQIALDLLKDDLGYDTVFGPDLVDSDTPERTHAEVVLSSRLQAAIDRINPHIPAEAREEAFKKVQRAASIDALASNEAFHVMLTDGIDVKFRVATGTRSDKVWLIDYNNPHQNNFLAVNQFTVIENHVNKRADLVLFINGLPLIVIELKNATDENADVYAAYQQLQTYKSTIPLLFQYNCFMIASDGWFAKAGTISSDFSRFMEWKTSDGENIVDTNTEAEMEPMLKGMLRKESLLDIIRYFIGFEKSKEKTIKKIAAYHQYYAVNKAIATTVRASGNLGDKRAGVIWHTQGSGKSLSMVFYTGKMVVEPAMNNPTIVVLTDRNDLDDQLFGTFCDCQQLLRQEPKQATNRKSLRDLLAVASGGIVFTTIQKFLPEEKGDNFPMLTDRRNVVVVADEAHRSQYDFIDGFARNMRDALPNASFIGFTGTPIEKQDASTQAVFGDYIDVYDIEQAVKDGATVRIYYESRLAKVKLSEEEKKIMDQKVEEITEDEELTDKQKRFAKWASKEAVVGSTTRLQQVAKDMVQHFDQRLNASKGKAMFVAMSRRIAVELHDEIVHLRPDWYSKDDDKGAIKVIMTGSSSDGPEWAEHIRNKKKRTDIGNRLKDPEDELKIVIVRDMWLTGFDAPVLHTLYVDKPMSGHNLMQAIARINRVFGDKQGGLVVDYIGIAQDLKKALATYTESKGKGKLTHDIDEAAAKMLEIYELVADLFAGFDYKAYFNQTPRQKMQFILEAANFILGLTEVDESGNVIRNGKQKYKDAVTRLSQAFALSVTHPDALLIRDDLAFFQAIKARIAKFDESKRKRSNQEIETALRQIVNDAIISEDVVDVYDAAGIKKPDISILDDKFLASVRNLPQKNLALELLKRLLNDEVKNNSKSNVSQGKKFSKLLEEAVKRYQSGLIEAAQVIDEMIRLAKEMREAAERGEKLDLRQDELAFYDALAENPTAETILGDKTLRAIAHELVESVRRNTSIDWQLKESVQAKIRSLIKRILRKYKYPPDNPATGEYTVSVNKVLTQAEMFADYWSGEAA
ncbi:type I restriction endonuclease subunit R [Segetibacter sp. 3557_3]|uniref:type I restriction endonuclease subunit R n=1 Tax=Segetibacter sp. 3557_3 TaxID=2547429 RepID=UPI0010587D58|nr:type I restriction endonuclease subunit R [Segetibacter sp. 3557_3]TDH26787.1 type I restriction endonuclease subunit R [Segetibacter sp. 3557_3]